MKKIKFRFLIFLSWNINHYKFKLNKFIKETFYPTFYYSYSSTDCDMCSSSGVGFFNGSRKAFDAYIDDWYEWLEGPGSLTEVTKEEYELRKDETTFRDRALEAYENGDGRLLNV